MRDNELRTKDRGDKAMGKRKNHDRNRYLNPRTVVFALLLAAAVLGAAFARWHWSAPVPPPVREPSTSGDKPPDNPPPVAAEAAEQAEVIDNVTDSIPDLPGITPDLFARYAEELAVTDAVLTGFVKSIEEHQIPQSDLGTTLREIAGQHKELLARLETVQSEDPEAVRLKQEARQAVEGGEYAKAEELLETVAAQNSLAAATYAELAVLQRVQLRYAKAANYWLKAAAPLPEEEKKDKAYYLNEAGSDLNRISRYSEALPLYEQSLEFCRAIGDRSQEGSILNNLAATAYATGDYAAALTYMEQSLAIRTDLGDRAGEAVTSWNIGRIHQEQGDLVEAEQHISRAVKIAEQIGLPSLEEWRTELTQVRAARQKLIETKLMETAPVPQDTVPQDKNPGL